MRYVHVGTKSELEDALFVPSVEEMDCIVEVESSINANAIVHRLFGLLFILGFTCPHFSCTLLTLNTRSQHFGKVCTPSCRKIPGHYLGQFSSSDDRKCTSLPSLWNTIYAVQVRIRQRQYLNITVFFFFLSNKNSICRVKLCDRPTICSDEFSQFHREGFILSLTLEDGSIGYGEVDYFVLFNFSSLNSTFFYICVTSPRSHCQMISLY